MTEPIRWRLDLGYDGAGFSGWAAQPGLRTVQGELQTWLGRILRLTEPPSLVCAGRTDAGVHARGQVAHVDLDPQAVTDPDGLLRRLRRVLPADLVVHAVAVAPAGFDARFAAVWRRYVYRIADAGTPPDPLLRGWVAALPEPLDLNRWNAAAATMVGLRDFGAFCRRREGATTVRTLLDCQADRITVDAASDSLREALVGTIACTVRADAFCHSMVRSLVGALVTVASGRRDVAWLRSVAERGVRDSGVPVLPAHGLTLEQVGYPEPSELAARVASARSRRETPT